MGEGREDGAGKEPKKLLLEPRRALLLEDSQNPLETLSWPGCYSGTEHQDSLDLTLGMKSSKRFQGNSYPSFFWSTWTHSKKKKIKGKNQKKNKKKLFKKSHFLQKSHARIKDSLGWKEYFSLQSWNIQGRCKDGVCVSGLGIKVGFIQGKAAGFPDFSKEGLTWTA